MKRIITLLVALLAAPTAVAAQAHGNHSHSGKETRQIKGLADEEVEALLNGQGMGLALSAELNSYPGPRHVLDLARELELSDSQVSRVRAIFDEMHAAAVPLGRRYVAQERELDRLFVDRRIDEARLREITAEIGRIQGELRAVHLRAHLRTTALLTPQQVRRYDVHRGYVASGGGHGHR